MSEERLKEIKDSIDFQLMIGTIKGHTLDVINEEKELYNEVIRLREALEISQNNEESYRLEMQDITKCLGLDEHTLFDDVKDYANDLQKRIDKAINKIQYIRYLGFDYDGFNNVENLKGLIDTLVDIAGQSVSILRGEDK